MFDTQFQQATTPQNTIVVHELEDAPDLASERQLCFVPVGSRAQIAWQNQQGSLLFVRLAKVGSVARFELRIRVRRFECRYGAGWQACENACGLWMEILQPNTRALRTHPEKAAAA